jgi:S-adenosylmethionine:tRNA ribosyltransferase-isomerase
MPAPSTPYTLADFDYTLPTELIAQSPPLERGASRLLDASGEVLRDRQFVDILSLLKPNDCLVFNNTKVVKARLHAQKTTGGRVEILFERLLSPQRFLAMLKVSHVPSVGAELVLPDGQRLQVVAHDGRFFTLNFAGDVLALLEQQGELPLPPYITHSPDAADDERYQTVYAEHSGAVAAPTAGLHFTQALLDQLSGLQVGQAMVTLHVGAGTFLPVRHNDLSLHEMHSESYTLTPDAQSRIQHCKAKGGRVIAVGTTSLRAVESWAVKGEASGDTNLFITPGYEFKLVDALITNFHLPKSTLMMLVSALAGYDPIRAAYQHAIQQRYRFFSYGDAMFLTRKDHV